MAPHCSAIITSTINEKLRLYGRILQWALYCQCIQPAGSSHNKPCASSNNDKNQPVCRAAATENSVGWCMKCRHHSRGLCRPVTRHWWRGKRGHEIDPFHRPTATARSTAGHGRHTKNTSDVKQLSRSSNYCYILANIYGLIIYSLICMQVQSSYSFKRSPSKPAASA